MSDKYPGKNRNIQDPITFGFAVTPSDGTDLPFVTRAIHVGGGGAIRVTLVDMDDGTFIDYLNCPDGAMYPRRIKRIWATGTAATDIVGEY